MKFNLNRLVAAGSIALLLLALVPRTADGTTAQHITLQHVYGSMFEVVQDGRPLTSIHRFHNQPDFQWPKSAAAAYAANRLPQKRILGFLAAGLEWLANDMPSMGAFRFALLGPKEVCLVARWYHRDAAPQEVICPAAGGGYWDTTLSHDAPGPLAWSIVDLKGNGKHEVISSRVAAGAYASPPIFWYTIYSFSDGLPHDVSTSFPDFYKVAFLPQLSHMERVLYPPQMAHTQPPRWARYEGLVLQFLRLKYRRKILGEKDAGLEQGLVWVKSPYIDVQGLGVETLGQIPGPASVAALRKLGEETRNSGVCVGVANALQSNGAISDA